MSLFGRRIIDKFKTTLPRLALPVPPYGSGKYWEKVYATLGASDVYEWGDLTMEGLEIIRYKRQFRDGIRDLYGDSVVAKEKGKGKEKRADSNHNADDTNLEENFDQAIGVYTNKMDSTKTRHHNDDDDDDDETKSSILILGCGNSNLGQEIYSYYDNQHQKIQSNASTQSAHAQANTQAKGEMNVNIIQCDISPSVVSSMSERYAHLPNMSIVQADACSHPKSNESNSFHYATPKQEHSIDAVVDKGLMDALFCSDKNLMPRVMMNVHRSLKVGSAFVFFSFSRPEYLLKKTIVRDNVWQSDDFMHGDRDDNNNGESSDEGLQLNLWSQVDVCELDSIFMYRFIKSDLTFVGNEKLLKESNMGKIRAMPSMHKRRRSK